MTQTVIKVSDVIDNAKVGPLQVGLFVLCAMCLILDGFDVQVVGLRRADDLSGVGQVPRSALGNVLAAGNFGVMARLARVHDGCRQDRPSPGVDWRDGIFFRR